MTIHDEKISWRLGKKLKKAIKVLAVGTAAATVAPLIGAGIVGASVLISARALSRATKDREYMRYVNSIED